MVRWMLTAIMIMGMVAAAAWAAEQKPPARKVNPAFQSVTDEPGLPRVLLIGDSISIGYTIPVRELLKGKANVHRPPTNSGDTARGVANIDAWLGEGRWDVIHFNFGLHDLKYVDEKGNLVAPGKGRQVASVEQYEQNLRQIVQRLQKTGARLVWASTTPVPQSSAGRVHADELKYNAAAAKIMRENDIAIDDLHALVVQNPGLQLPGNVHFTPEGCKELARTVAGSIEQALKKQDREAMGAVWPPFGVAFGQVHIARFGGRFPFTRNEL